MLAFTHYITHPRMVEQHKQMFLSKLLVLAAAAVVSIMVILMMPLFADNKREEIRNPFIFRCSQQGLHLHLRVNHDLFFAFSLSDSLILVTHTSFQSPIQCVHKTRVENTTRSELGPLTSITVAGWFISLNPEAAWEMYSSCKDFFQITARPWKSPKERWDVLSKSRRSS